MSHNIILEMKGVTKEFSGVKALSDISFQVYKNDIHVICGENGAGKSTLMKILSGVYPYGSYSGNFYLNGVLQKYHSIKESEHAGIGIIYQELALVKNLSITENLFLGNELTTSSGMINWNIQHKRAKEILQLVKMDVYNPNLLVKYLGIGQQQLLEIAKALLKDVSVLLLDEPTAALNEVESQNLLQIMRDLQKKGITCMFISHKLEEVLSIANAITVIRDGTSIIAREENTAQNPIQEDTLIQHMVGRVIENRFPIHDTKHSEDVLFEIKNWNVLHPDIKNKKLIDNVNFSLYKGEILGIAGLMGAGRTELATSIFASLHAKHTGQLYLEGCLLNIKNIESAIAAGIGYVTEDRKGQGFIGSMNILENTILPSLKRFSKRWGVIQYIEAFSQARFYNQKMKVKAASFEQEIIKLSGGNQQKVILAKWLLAHPKLLILDEPTRGIDVGAKYDIYQLMNELVDNGVGIIMISSELPEILGMSDRIAVISDGILTGILNREEATQEKIMKLATKSIKETA